MTTRSAGFYLPFGPAKGLGHLVRSAALAARLRARGWETILIAEDDGPLPEFCADAFTERRPPAWGEATALAWLVVDHPKPDEGYVSAVQGAGSRVLRIFDGTERCVVTADIVLNQNLGRVMDPGHPAQTVLVGPNYAILRAAFAQARPRARQGSERARLRRVLIAPGATDVCRITERLIPRLVEDGFEVDIALSAVAENIETVRTLANAHDGRVGLVVDADAQAMAALLCGSDIVVGNGGIGAWERCVLGAPAILLEMVPDQRDNIQALVRSGACVEAGHGNDADMADRVGALLTSLRVEPHRLGIMSECAFSISDGLGAERVVAEIDPRRLADGQVVRLRLATAEDCRQVYAWQSLPETRRHARNPALPTWEEHQRWFASKLADHRVIMTLIEVGGSPAGGLRLDYVEDRQGAPVYEVSIFLDPDVHGRGVGRNALQEAANLLPFAWLKAVVLPQNDTSLHLFRRAGYEEEAGAFYLSPRA